MKKYLKRGIITIFGIALFGVSLLGLTLAFPAPLFPYSAKIGQISFRSDLPIPDSALSVLSDINQRLEGSPIPVRQAAMDLYVVNSNWKRTFIWLATNPAAGGFVVVPVTRWHGFLSGADFERGLLVSPSGNLVPAPRTLAYYSAHELTHTVSGEFLGSLDYHQMPEWVREGIADYVAMPDEKSFEELYAEIGDKDADLSMMNSYGVYAPYRLLVSFFLNGQKWPIEKLLKSRLTKAEARAIMREHLKPAS